MGKQLEESRAFALFTPLNEVEIVILGGLGKDKAHKKGAIFNTRTRIVTEIISHQFNIIALNN